MKLTKSFWIAQVITLVLFFTPWLLTRNMPASDGTAVAGFPLVFYSYTPCMISPCTYYFPLNAPALFADVLVILGIPLLVNFFFNRKRI